MLQTNTPDHDPHIPPPGHDDAVPRRGLLGRGALVAGAAGLVAATTMARTPAAHAADRDALVLGQANDARRATRLTLDSNGSVDAALVLSHESGPSLELTPTSSSWSADLAVGQIASLPGGPVVGVDQGSGPQNAFVAFDLDLDALSLPVAIPPVRALDTRVDDGRASIVSSSAHAFDSSGRLRARQWLELALAPTEETTIDGVYANLTVTKATKGGYLSVYPDGDRPTASSINYRDGQTIANAGLFATGISDGWWVVRIYSSGTTHVIFDVTGFTVSAASPVGADGRSRRRVSRLGARRGAAVVRARRALSRS